MSFTAKSACLMMACVALALVSGAPAQATQAAQPVGALTLAPYLGVGVQNAYYDDVIQFSDGSSEFLTVDPRASLLLGLQVEYRFRPLLSLHANVSTTSQDADYIEDLTPRPRVDVRTTQFDIGLLYRAATLRVGGNDTPLSVGGGLSLTSHSLKRFTWSGDAIRPSSTSVGVHGLAMLDIPLTSTVDFRGQAKLSVTPLSLTDLEEKLAAAEGGGITAAVDGGTSTYFQFLFGVAFRL